MGLPRDSLFSTSSDSLFSILVALALGATYLGKFPFTLYDLSNQAGKEYCLPIHFVCLNNKFTNLHLSIFNRSECHNEASTFSIQISLRFRYFLPSVSIKSTTLRIDSELSIRFRCKVSNEISRLLVDISQLECDTSSLHQGSGDVDSVIRIGGG